MVCKTTIDDEKLHKRFKTWKVSQRIGFSERMQRRILKSNHTDEYNVFVIIDEPIIADKDHYFE